MGGGTQQIVEAACCCNAAVVTINPQRQPATSALNTSGSYTNETQRTSECASTTSTCTQKDGVGAGQRAAATHSQLNSTTLYARSQAAPLRRDLHYLLRSLFRLSADSQTSSLRLDSQPLSLLSPIACSSNSTTGHRHLALSPSGHCSPASHIAVTDVIPSNSLASQHRCSRPPLRTGRPLSLAIVAALSCIASLHSPPLFSAYCERRTWSCRHPQSLVHIRP